MPQYVVERFWPDVTAADVAALSSRLREAAAHRPDVRYLGSMLLMADDVVQCRFEAPDEDAVRRFNEAAAAPLDRVLVTVAYAP